MSSSGLIYAVIVGAWAAYLVPMWLRRQDELNEARPTERFSTAIRLLSGRAGMERRYAKDLRARSADEGEPSADPDAVTDSVDVRAFAMPPYRAQTKAQLPVERGEPSQPGVSPQQGARQAGRAAAASGASGTSGASAGSGAAHASAAQAAQAASKPTGKPTGKSAAKPAGKSAAKPAPAKRVSGARRGSSAEAKARARRSKALARRRRTTVMLFMAFTLGAVVAAVGGVAFLWAPAVPAVLLSAYIAHLRVQERRRFAFTMDRRRAEVAAQRLRESRPRRRPQPEPDLDEPEDGPESEETRPDLTALAADRRALVEQTDHAEWVDQQRERQRRPGHGDSWDPVPVPLPTYVTAPVAPRSTSDVDLGAPDAWSSARSSSADPNGSSREPEEPEPDADEHPEVAGAPDDGRSDARRAASARRSRERGRTPLFDQYEDGDRPRAANE
ncbi:hypothetical protein SGFS_051820 [Streptomyces graminofaciens]|uniref:Uncharacterized protein n=1 Tax=Streptomyces graminofaciens TaxID=68212 RepID=A0ABM7FC49_9ACTN|nr:gephyrin-like molybdotransferase receptor GlpR [Streptomyces graminofaciens]BBC33888.1 hypothetical protein SGFS_051820 [Streptomyces graminofaciens]